MTTNLLATIIVTLTTNTITTDNAPEHFESVPNIQGNITYTQNTTAIGYGRFVKNSNEATEKTETTTVTETRTVAFDIEGQHREDLLSQREVSRCAKTYKLDAKWTLVNTDTNVPRYSMTNRTTFGGLAITNNQSKETK